LRLGMGRDDGGTIAERASVRSNGPVQKVDRESATAKRDREIGRKRGLEHLAVRKSAETGGTGRTSQPGQR
jgi:hypothetical protein